VSGRLLAADRTVTLPMAAITRPWRAGEVDDVDHRFVNDAANDCMISAGEFVERALVLTGRDLLIGGLWLSLLRHGITNPVMLGAVL
jgi:guanylate kinase